MSSQDFFSNNTVREVAELHIERVSSLEDREARRVLKQYKAIRQELRDRIDYLPDGTFTDQKMKSVLVQVESAILEMSRNLKKEMSDSAQLAAESSIENLIREIEQYQDEFIGASIPINLNAVEAATRTTNFLINRYDASLDAYSVGIRSRISQGLVESVIAQESLSEVTNRLSKMFLGEEWKLLQIARTELHNVYNVGKLNGMSDLVKEDIPDLKKTLFHPMDKRTGEDSKKLAQDNPIIPVDEPFVEYSTGKKLIYMAPPNRPNDRAILIPYRKGWG